MKKLTILLTVLWLSVFTLNAQTFKGTITQYAGNDPTAVVFENTFGVEPVFTRVSTGLYRVYIPDAFPDEDRIFGLSQQVLESSPGTTLHFARLVWDDVSDPTGSSLLIYTFDRNMQNGIDQAADSRLNRTPISFTVYPLSKKRQ